MTKWTMTTAKSRLEDDIEKAHRLYEARVKKITNPRIDKSAIERAQNARKRREASVTRELAAFNMREQGATFRVIGERFGVKSMMAQTLVARGERYSRIKHEPWHKLSVRTCNALRNENIPNLEPGTVAEYITRYDLKRAPNIGKVSIHEIEAWLEEHGQQLRDY